MLGSIKHENLLPGKGCSPVILTEISNKSRFLRNQSIPHDFSYRYYGKSLGNKIFVLSAGLK